MRAINTETAHYRSPDGEVRLWYSGNVGKLDIAAKEPPIVILANAPPGWGL